MLTSLLERQDHQLLDRVGELTGRMPGNTVRGRTPLRKAAMSPVVGQAIRNRILPGLRKAAEAGPSTHQQFSESFASMAFTFLEERAPSLREFMVGFQVVDKGDDGNNAFGVFGFELPSRVVQIPVFFIDGQVKGFQLLFIPAQQLFTPLHEGFVQRLINTDAMKNGVPGPVYGDMSGMADPQSVAGQIPQVIKRAEFLQKHSSHTPRPWAVKMGVYNSVATWLSNKQAAEQFADVVKTGTYKSAACDLDYYLTRSSDHLAEAVDLALKFPVLRRAMDADDSVRMTKLASVAQENDRIAAVVAGRTQFLDRAESGISRGGIGKKAQDLTRKPALVFHFDPQLPRFLASTEVSRYQEKIAANGLYVEDNRSVDKLAEATEIPTSEDLTSDQPYQPSKVKLLDQAGKPREAMYFPSRFCYASKGTSLLITTNNNSVAATAGQVVVVGNPDDNQLKFEDFGKEISSTLEKGKLYIVCDKHLNVYGPFYVDDVVADGIYRIDVPGFTRREFNYNMPVAVSESGRRQVDQLILNSEHTSLSFTDSVASNSLGLELALFVPTDARILEIKAEPADDDWSRDNPRPEIDFSPMTFESMSAKDIAKMTVAMQKSAAAGYYKIAGRQLTKRAALITLIQGFKLTEKSAEAVLNSLTVDKLRHFVFKDAATQQMMMEDPSAIFPQLEGPVGHSDSSRVPYVIDAPEQGSETIPNAMADSQDPMMDGYEDVEEGHPTLPGNSGAMGGGMPAIPTAAQQVMGSGMQGPMDVTALASIVANSRIDSAISQASGQILRGNSEIGQLLLLFYAQTSAFEDVYSENNMQSLEDTMLNAFDANGDLYLRLKQTNIAADPTTEAATPDSHMVEV